MTEKLLQFGEGKRLSGIVTLPETDAQGPLVVIISAGIVHRVGPNRLHVKLAHTLAAEGLPVLRFDLSGLGESAPAPPGLGYEAQSVADTNVAIGAIRAAFGTRPVILAGLCSGADNAIATALENDAVEGLILLDPHAYQHKAAHMAYLARRAQDPEKLGAFIGNLSARLTRVGRAADSGTEVEPDPDNDRIAPPREQFGRDLAHLSARGAETLIFYTRSVQHLINAPSQFFETFSDFDLKERVNVITRMEADHTYTDLSAQAELLAQIRAWVKKA